MYWIPAFFIFVEIFLILSVDKLSSYGNAKFLFDKYKDENLKKYIQLNYHGIDVMTNIFGFLLLGELIYFIIGFFYPMIWMFSALIIFVFLISTIFSKMKKEVPIEKRIKLAKLKGFETTDIQFSRLLKLNQLKDNEIKTNEWIKYIFPLFRIIIFISIIVLHYNFSFSILHK